MRLLTSLESHSQSEIVTRPGAPLPSLLMRAVDSAHPGARHDEKDERIMAAALRVLAERGTQLATMDDVAAASGVSRATLFRRYGSKDGLFEHLMRQEFGRILDDVALRFTTAADPYERTLGAFAGMLQLRNHPLFFGADRVHHGELLAALGRGEPSMMQMGHQFLVMHLTKGQERGLLPPGDPQVQADLLIHMTIGYLVAPPSILDLDDPAVVASIARQATAVVDPHASNRS